MAMLAEPRRKQKWTLNPRGKHWSDDSNKFGQKMLEKMGWSSGKGLGANLDGMTEHIRCKYKNDQAGIGFSHDNADKQWTEHQEGFNELLQKLHNGEATETEQAAESKPVAESELSGKSLELKSKQSRARVHYQKFTRGKDVNKYSAKDLANIFGKKDLDDKTQEPEKPAEVKPEPEEAAPEPIGSSDSSHGVVTIKGGSISDYFKSKMSALGRKFPAESANDSESESETRAGFGFSTPKAKSEPHEGPNFSASRVKFEPSEASASFKTKSETPKKSLETHFSYVNPALDLATPKKDRETPRKRKSEFAFENPALDVASPQEAKETPRKRKSDYVFDNPALQICDGPTEENTPTKRRKNDFAFENGGLDLDCPLNGETATAVSSHEEQSKKKRKKKPKECIPPMTDGFTNEALNLDGRDDETSNSSQFEIARPCFGLANDALDLTDETNGRKRVTFNETLEFDTDVTSGKRKKKKAGKLDKFEVDNEKLRRKKKKERREEAAESAFVNEAMEVDAGSQEASENAANERKSEKARRKRERGVPSLETIAEAPDEEKESAVEVVTLDESLVGEASEGFEVLSLETPKKKKKKRKNREAEGTAENPELSTTIDISEEDVEFVEEISTVDSEDLEKKSKKKKKSKKEKLSVAEEQEEMEITDGREANLEKGKKEKTRKKLSEETKENVDTENVCAAAVENLEQAEGAKKRKKQKKAKREREEGIANAEKIEEGNEAVFVREEAASGVDAEGTEDGKGKKSKKSFKALFARTPIVNFVGSNINEIKGYGVDLK